MAENYSPEIAKAVENFLSENGWGYEPHDDYGRIQTDIKLNCKFRKADIDIIINEDSFLVYLILPMTADKEVQKEMTEFLTRINYGLESCNFEMDFSDGEIRCKCFCNCADTVPTNQQISNCIFFNTATVNNYGNGIAKILFGIGTPEEVYLECKKTLQEEKETKDESFQDITEEKAVSYEDYEDDDGYHTNDVY